MKEFLSTTEAAKALSGVISRTTIWRMCCSGTLTAAQVGNRWVVPAWAVEELVADISNRRHT
jgi:excisionase family DNA binding protein